MEKLKTSIELMSSKNYDNEDLVQECSAYMKTKIFMAKRIAEQQAEIEYLKEQLSNECNRHAGLYDMIRNLNEGLKELKGKSENVINEEDKINISGELTNSIVIDEDNECVKINEKDKLIYDETNLKTSICNICHLNQIEVKHEKTILNALADENLELREKYEIIKTENIRSNTNIKRLAFDKFILFTELNELVVTLKRIDNNILNKFYLKNAFNYSDIDSHKQKMSLTSLHNNDMISSMGIKYNILSAQSQLLLLSSSESDEGRKLFENVDYAINNLVVPSHEQNMQFIKIDRYLGVIKKYEDELNGSCINSNLTQTNN